MDKTMRLDADHGHSRHHGGSKADRLMHSRCNRQRHEGDNDDRRPALGAADAFTPRPIQLLDGTDDPRWPAPTPDTPVNSGFNWGAVTLG
ncbi:MAG: hypothetical protein ACI38U_14270 [Corynebacterium sp.]|uniref:hypothetical protein n=1 Tax=Corynebacterium sp. TaxID=1720 RepID=UPI003F0CCAF2